MPPSRLRYSIGRRPSGFASPTSGRVKPGIYGASPSPRSVTFAPNVTPVTYKESDDLTLEDADESLPLDAQLFPPSEQPSMPASKRRVPPGKRRSLGYIPRPPNAFMLFRADFVRQKHVPGSIETNHGSLSKIIGNCWRALPLDEKRIWEIKAKQEKDAHSKRYPGYRFKPVHNKDKAKKKEKAAPTPEDERRCEEVAQLLLEGMKGDELAAAIRKLDQTKAAIPAYQPPYSHQAFYPPRRSSSVPPDARLHPITIPSIPFFSSRSTSPVGNISRRMIIGQRRPSSALPHFGRTSWGVDDIPMTFPDLFLPPQSSLQRDESPLPEVNTGLFQDGFNFDFSTVSREPAITTFNMFSDLPPHAASGPSTSYDLAQMGHISPQELPLSVDYLTAHVPLAHADVLTGASTSGWTNMPLESPDVHSVPSSSYSGSPAHSDASLPSVVAPQPQHAPTAGFASDMWHEAVMGTCHAPEAQQGLGHVPAVAIAGDDYSVSMAGMGSNAHIPVPAGLEMFYDATFMGMTDF